MVGCVYEAPKIPLHCREHETKFLVRTLVSNLRVGANWRSVIGAMARAVVMHREGPRVPKARLDAAATAASEAYHVSNADLEQSDRPDLKCRSIVATAVFNICMITC